MTLDQLKIYLPKFLSVESERELFSGIKAFPENIDERLYTTYLNNDPTIFQGDGICDLLAINLPSTVTKETPCMVLSNTCDVDPINKRNFPSQLVYAPIINLRKYHDGLLKQGVSTEQQIKSHIEAIKRQSITQVFYLPQIEGKLDESIVFFDRVISYPNKLVSRDNLKERRLFTLSDYGIYLFLFKYSIHSTRIQDKVDRRSLNI